MSAEIARVAAVLALLPAITVAQSINLDLGGGPPTLPSPTYGAAAQQSGPWNDLSFSGANEDSTSVANLIDVGGQVTVVGATCSLTPGSGGLQGADIGLYDLTGNVGALMLDGIGAGNYGVIQILFEGLQPGPYEVWTYAGPGTQIDVIHAVEGWLPANYQTWQGYPVEGQHYVIHHMSVSSDGRLRIIPHFPGWREILAVQLIRLEGAPTRATCLGDGSATACPCGNTGGAGRGCATSFGPGARLLASGVASVTSDSLVLATDGVSNSTVTFFQGTQPAAAGAGVVFGDGLRCATGSLIRLGAKLASSNAAAYPQPGDPAVSIRGAIPAYGGTRIYQVWFRNAADYCTSATYNWSSGLAVSWQP